MFEIIKYILLGFWAGVKATAESAMILLQLNGLKTKIICSAFGISIIVFFVLKAICNFIIKKLKKI